MSDNSKIEWTSSTWNPTTGCTKVSPGCANCYIASTPPFRMAGRKFEKGHIPLILHEDRLTQPLHWAKPRRIFVNSLSDLFHKDIPDDFIAEVYGTMVAAYWHEFQVLTKRPERRAELLKSTVFRAKVTDAAARHVAALRGRCPDGCEAEDMRPLERWECASNALDVWEHDGRAPNIWEGATVENQRFADERIPILLDTPAAVRFLSCEPLLGQLHLEEYLNGRNEVSRRGGLSGGDDGRTDHRFGGSYLASGGPARQQVDGWNDDDPVRSPEGRESNGIRLPSSESDDRLLANARLGPPAGLEALQRPNPSGADHQPQERQPIRQPAGEFGTGDGFRAGPSQDSRIGMEARTQLSWVIVGGESGPKARSTDIGHIRSIVRQCQAAGVAVFYKQGGYHNRCPHDRKGGHFECFPDDLKVREFPNAIGSGWEEKDNE